MTIRVDRLIVRAQESVHPKRVGADGQNTVPIPHVPENKIQPTWLRYPKLYKLEEEHKKFTRAFRGIHHSQDNIEGTSNYYGEKESREVDMFCPFLPIFWVLNLAVYHVDSMIPRIKPILLFSHRPCAIQVAPELVQMWQIRQDKLEYAIDVLDMHSAAKVIEEGAEVMPIHVQRLARHMDDSLIPFYAMLLGASKVSNFVDTPLQDYFLLFLSLLPLYDIPNFFLPLLDLYCDGYLSQ
jgi:hypothetical protein